MSSYLYLANKGYLPIILVLQATMIWGVEEAIWSIPQIVEYITVVIQNPLISMSNFFFTSLAKVVKRDVNDFCGDYDKFALKNVANLFRDNHQYYYL